MKNYKKNSKNLLAFVCIAGSLTLLLSSCSKPSMNYVSATPIAALSIIQASPDEPLIDFFINNGKVNSSSFLYGQSSNYFSINAGKDPIAYYNETTNKVILADTIQFNQNTAYSLFLANKASQPEVVLLLDSLSKPTAGNAAVRFVNLSPDAPAADLVVQGGATVVSNKSYKKSSSFVPIPGNMSYKFEVHQAGTATVLATLPSVNLSTGFLYTIYFHGLAAGTAANADQLSVDIINNAYFL